MMYNTEILSFWTFFCSLEWQEKTKNPVILCQKSSFLRYYLHGIFQMTFWIYCNMMINSSRLYCNGTCMGSYATSGL
jgi:hypothetical protein